MDLFWGKKSSQEKVENLRTRISMGEKFLNMHIEWLLYIPKRVY